MPDIHRRVGVALTVKGTRARLTRHSFTYFYTPYGGTASFYNSGQTPVRSLTSNGATFEAPFYVQFSESTNTIGGIDDHNPHYVRLYVSNSYMSPDPGATVHHQWETELPTNARIYAAESPLPWQTFDLPSGAKEVWIALTDRVIGETIAGKTQVTDVLRVYSVFEAMPTSFIGDQATGVRFRSRLNNGNLSPFTSDVAAPIFSVVRPSVNTWPADEGLPDAWSSERRDHAYVRDNPDVYRWYSSSGAKAEPTFAWYVAGLSDTHHLNPTTQEQDIISFFDEFGAAGPDGVNLIEISIDFEEPVFQLPIDDAHFRDTFRGPRTSNQYDSSTLEQILSSDPDINPIIATLGALATLVAGPFVYSAENIIAEFFNPSDDASRLWGTGAAMILDELDRNPDQHPNISQEDIDRIANITDQQVAVVIGLTAATAGTGLVLPAGIWVFNKISGMVTKAMGKGLASVDPPSIEDYEAAVREMLADRDDGAFIENELQKAIQKVVAERQQLMRDQLEVLTDFAEQADEERARIANLIKFGAMAFGIEGMRWGARRRRRWYFENEHPDLESFE